MKVPGSGFKVLELEGYGLKARGFGFWDLGCRVRCRVSG